MKKATVIWLIAAAGLVIAGGVLFVVAMTMSGWDFTKLSTESRETNEYRVEETYGNISVQTDTADIRLIPSEDGTTKVICHEKSRATHKVEVRDGTLYIELVDTRKWYDHINIGVDHSEITICLPGGEYGAMTAIGSTCDVKIPAEFGFRSLDVSVSTGDVTTAASVAGAMRIKASTGDIRLDHLSAQSLSLTVSTGKITATGVTVAEAAEMRVSTGKVNLKDLSCGSLTSTGNTGDMSMINVVATGTMSITRSTGDVRMDACDAAEIVVKTDTGDVTGTLLTEKVFMVKTDTGDVDVPRSVTGGACEITTDTGDIRVDILGK